MSRLFTLALLFAGALAAGCGGDEAPEERDDLPPQVRAYLTLGTQAMNTNRYEDALAYADSAARLAPQAPDPYMLRGRTYAELGDIARSDSAYLHLAGIQPDYPGVWHNLGNNAFRRQVFSEAVRYHYREVEHNPAPIPWRGIGRAYVEVGQVDSARYAFEQALAMDSTYAPAWFSLALLDEDEGDLDRALAAARAAHRHAPNDYDYRYLMASLMLQTGRVEEALPHLEAVTDEWPWHHPSHYNRGQALAQLGRTEEAQAMLETAEALRAGDAKVMHLVQTAQSVPDDPLTHAALGTALVQVGRLDDAERAYMIAHHLDPENLDVQVNIANLYVRRKDVAGAVRWYQQVLEQDPERVEAWMNLGVVFAKAARPEEALAAWRQALSVDPNNATVRGWIANMERQMAQTGG